MDLAARRADEQYALVWVPLVSESGYRFDGEPVVLASGPREFVAREWAAKLRSEFVTGDRCMESFGTVGKAAETSAYALHVIGRGTLRVVAPA